MSHTMSPKWEGLTFIEHLVSALSFVFGFGFFAHSTFSHLILTANQGSLYQYSHFTDEKTEPLNG